MLVHIIGFLAAATSTIALIPQIYKLHKTKSSKDLSILMLINFLCSSILWLCYGMMTACFAVVLCNLFMTLATLWMLVLSIKYD